MSEIVDILSSPLLALSNLSEPMYARWQIFQPQYSAPATTSNAESSVCLFCNPELMQFNEVVQCSCLLNVDRYNVSQAEIVCWRWVVWRLEYWWVRYCNGIFRIRGIGCLMHTNVRVVWALYSTLYSTVQPWVAVYSGGAWRGLVSPAQLEWPGQHQHQPDTGTHRNYLLQTYTTVDTTQWWRMLYRTETQDQCYKCIALECIIF